MGNAFRGGARPASTGPRPSSAGPSGFARSQTSAIDLSNEYLKQLRELAEKLHASRQEMVVLVAEDMRGKLKAQLLGLSQKELPGAVSQAINKHVTDATALLDDPNADATEFFQGMGYELPEQLKNRHHMLRMQFQNALKKYLTSESRQDSKSTPFSPQRAKDELSDLWELGLVLSIELGVFNTTTSSEAGQQKLMRSLLNVPKAAAWKALEILEAAYKAWVQNPKSEALQERLAEAKAILEVVLFELNKFDEMDKDDTIIMIGRKMKSFSS